MNKAKTVGKANPHSLMGFKNGLKEWGIIGKRG